MATFELQGPDGATYQIEAPDERAAFSAFQKMQAGSPEQSSTLADVAKSAGTGLVKGAAALATTPQTIVDALQWAANKPFDLLGAPPRAKTAVDALPEVPRAPDVVRGIEAVAGPLHKPQTTAGKYAQTIGEFAPATVLGPANLARRVAQTVLPAVGSEAAGQATEGTAAEPYARVVGALAAGTIPAIGARAVSPLRSTPERQAMVDTLRREGVTDVTAGQATGRRGLQYFESELGGGQTAAKMDRQAEQFTAAALRRAGETATRATPDVIKGAFDRIGDVFDDVTTRNSITLTPVTAQRLGNRLGDIADDYASLVPAPAPIVGQVIAQVVNTATQNAGTIPGPVYQAMRSRLDKAARSLATSDTQLSHALSEILEVLDKSMERSLLASGKQGLDDLNAWRKARREYKNMLVIEKAATGAGVNAAMGLISPSALRNATVVQSRRGYAKGQGDFAELARAGEAIMKPLPQSGTAPRQATRAPGAILGAAAGAPGGPLTAALGAAAGLYGPRLLGAAAMSGPGQRYLGNQAASGTTMGLDPLRAALLQSLLLPVQETR